jgi:hypothetical protein
LARDTWTRISGDQWPDQVRLPRFGWNILRRRAEIEHLRLCVPMHQIIHRNKDDLLGQRG